MSSARELVEELIYRASLLLDEHDFEGYLELCSPAFRYAIHAHSPEIRRDMVWMDLDKAGLSTLFRTLPRHNSDHAPLSRHVTVYTVTVDEAKGEARAVSALQVFQTALDGGHTTLFAVGKLHDTIQVAGTSATLLSRTIKLDTRLLGIGSHIPF